MEGAIGTARRPRNRSGYAAPERWREVVAADALGELTFKETMYAPAKLFLAGDDDLLRGTRRVAIVGSREASAAALGRAYDVAGELARAGVVVVSGLAKGVDRAAHEGALDAGGRTIAVIGTPLDRAYPAENAALQERIHREHLLVSQFPASTKTFPSHFVQRNRTMALVAHASVIIECGDTSGTLSQAAEMQRLERPLFFSHHVLERRDLAWPARFEAAGAIVLYDARQVLAVV